MSFDWYTEMLHRCYGGAWEQRLERDALAAATRRAKTAKRVECEASQSGGRKPVTPNPCRSPVKGTE